VGWLVRVEPLEERHREGLRGALQAELEILCYTAFRGDFDVWFEEALAASDEVPFAVVVDGREVGSTRFLNFAAEHARVEIGWTWLRRSQWSTGANAETKLLLLEHAFERHGMRRVEFKTDSRNERTRGALLALGAQFEGIFRKHMLLPSGSRDSAWYAIVDDTWPSVKEALQRRLESFARSG
jgi:RimJ/RimL family protein N-acetyltransferase